MLLILQLCCYFQRFVLLEEDSMRFGKNVKLIVSSVLIVILAALPLTACDKGDVASKVPVMRPFGTYELEPVEIAKAKVPAYNLKPDLSNVSDIDKYVIGEDLKAVLAKNHFAIIPGGYDEFFEIYEQNRYSSMPNFVTVDSMLHTYHLYFNYILRTVEEEELYPELLNMSKLLVNAAREQHKQLKGTEWEAAAKMNLAFFSVGAALLDDDIEIDPAVYDQVSRECELINEHEKLTYSPVMTFWTRGDKEDMTPEDYTQYTPRGHYTKNKERSKFFRAMMFYGRQTFRFSNDDELRAAILMSYALMNSDAVTSWLPVYETTAFFSGISDDITPFEVMTLIESVYGQDPDYKALAKENADSKNFKNVRSELQKMNRSKINSIPVFDEAIQPDREKVTVGMRLMGQRYTLDADVFQRLVYREVKENAAGDKRMLPKALDIPAAMGSDTALDILKKEGEFAYKNYEENMTGMRKKISEIKEKIWQSNLYWGWLYNLKPLTEETPDGYPEFMKSRAWALKNLNTFIGSWTELKHDTVLYSKQVIAEMGGPPEPMKPDDRGYVEPQPEIYARLAALSGMTRTGLKERDLLSENIEEALEKLEKMALKLKKISEKELAGKDLTKEEYKFIKTIGGDLEHMWAETVDLTDDDEKEYILAYEHPSALIVDIATGDGEVLHEATGFVKQIVAAVPVAGKLKLVSGPVFSTYEFTMPGRRLTDSEWVDWMRFGEDIPEMRSWLRDIVFSGDGFQFFLKYEDYEEYEE